jgi:hypothetical protein
MLDLSLAVPIANSLTFAFTALSGVLLGEDFGSWRMLILYLIHRHCSRNSIGHVGGCHLYLLQITTLNIIIVELLDGEPLHAI